MKINQVYIYGFGKWQSLQMNHLHSLQLIYGENEAGKSTILKFIKSILFGFPTKQKGELLYIPKTTQSYGGELECITDTFGIVRIKRIKGKSASGDVTVTLENGQIGNEALLEKVLNGLTLQMFQAIYSFDVHGIQHIQQLKGAELSRYLLHAGSIGSDTFLKAEQQLKKQKEALFKPSGRNPVMNQAIKNLKEQDKQLKEAKKKNDGYQQLINEIDAIELENKRTQSHIQSLSEQKRMMELVMEHWDDVQSYHQLTKQYQALDIEDFPIDGEQKLFHLEDKEQEFVTQSQVLKEKAHYLRAQIEKLSINKTLLTHASEIQLVVAKKENMQHIKEQLDTLQVQAQQLDSQLDEWKRQLGWLQRSTDFLETMDTSFQMKEKIQQQMKDFYRLKAKMEDKKNQVAQMKRDVQQIEFTCDQLEKNMVSEKEYRHLIDSQHKTVKMEHNKQTVWFSYLFIATSFLFMVLSYVRSDVMMFAALLICFLLSIVLTVLQRKKLKQQPALSNDVQDLINEQNNFRKQWKEAIVALESKQFHYNQVMEEQQALYKKEETLEQACAAIREQLLLPKQFPIEQLLDAFQLIEKAQTTLMRKKELLRAISSYQNQLDNWEAAADRLFNTLGMETGLFLIEDITRLEKTLQETKEKEIVWKEWQTKLDECQEHIKDKEIQLRTIQQQVQSLLQAAHVEHRDAYLRKAKNMQLKEELEKKLHVLEAKLSAYPDVLLSAEYIQLEKQLQQMLSDLDKYKSTLSSNQDRLAELRYEQDRLEAGGTFTQLLHTFHESTHQLNEQAKEWATLSLSLQLLKGSLACLTKERFPKVMQIAQSYFQHLTDNQYTSLLLQDDQFLIKKEDGNIFLAEELSQATAEQLYISLRFALVTMLQETTPFPLIIDDGFVHFDQTRTNNVVALLKQMSRHTQIIFFTCHTHIKALFQQEHVVSLSDVQLGNQEFMKNNG